MTSGRTHDAATRRLLLPALAAAGLLALGACGSDPVPGGGGGGGGYGGGGPRGTTGTDWPEPYGTELDAEAVSDFCGVNTNQVTDTYVSYDHSERQQAGSWGFADGSQGLHDAGPTTAAGPAPVRAPDTTRTMIPGQPGAITDVRVELVAEPTDPTFTVDITLTGPDDDAEYTADYAYVSFLSVNSEQAWVGFPLVDGELDGRVDLDEPITVTSEGATGRLEVVPVACPTDDGTWTVEPLPDGEYELSIYGTADALGEVELEDEDDPGYDMPVFGVWGQERTLVTVTDGVISGIGYDGENAYDGW